MTDGIVTEVADRLWRAEIDRASISPVTEKYPGLTAAVPVRPGSVVSAEFGGLGTVDVYG